MHEKRISTIVFLVSQRLLNNRPITNSLSRCGLCFAGEMPRTGDVGRDLLIACYRVSDLIARFSIVTFS